MPAMFCNKSKRSVGPNFISSQAKECSVRGSETSTECVSFPYSVKMRSTIVTLLWFLFDIEIEGSIVSSSRERYGTVEWGVEDEERQHPHPVHISVK